MSSTWPGMKWVRNERSFAHGQAGLVIGRPRPLQILGYRRISPGFWWLSNASALAFEHRECSGRNEPAHLVRRGERERESAYVCVRMRDRGLGRGGRGRGRSLDSDGYPVPIYTHRWRKGTRESATTVVLVNTGKERGGKSSRRRYR